MTTMAVTSIMSSLPDISEHSTLVTSTQQNSAYPRTLSFMTSDQTSLSWTTSSSISPAIFQSTATILQNTTISDDYVRARLLELSDMKALLFLPVIVFIAILMICSVFGNLVVIIIYCQRYKSRSSNYFIITMSIFDLLAGLVSIPIDIYDLRYHYAFYSTTACKLFRYASNITTIGSAVILIMIAFDRYFKICQPLKIGTEAKTKCLCYLSGILASILAIPALVLFGIAKTPTEEDGLLGFDCSIEEQYKTGTFRNIYYIMLMLIFVLTFVLLAGLYIRIWVEIRRRKDMVIGDKTSKKRSLSDNVEGGRDIIRKTPIRLGSVSDDDTSVFTSKPTFKRSFSTVSRMSRLNSITEAISRVKVSRTTKIFIAVTIAFVLSYLPGLVIQILRSTNERLNKNPSPADELVMKLFARSHYINNAINPVIYSFLNVNFRTHCKRLFRSVLVSCKKKRLIHRQNSSSTRCSFRKVKPSNTDSNKSNPTREYEMENLQNNSREEFKGNINLSEIVQPARPIHSDS